MGEDVGERGEREEVAVVKERELGGSEEDKENEAKERKVSDYKSDPNYSHNYP